MNRKAIVLSILTFVTAGVVNADLIQHLDATISGSVLGNPVTQWTDQTGKNNHALPKVGSVFYPSTSKSASGLSGLDFGAGQNSLQLFDATGQDSWLNQTSGNGFCVLIAFKCDSLVGGWDDLIGNSSATGSGFGMRWSGSGAMQAYLGGVTINKGGQSVAAGDTIVYGFNYNAATNSYELWDSKNESSMTGTVTAGDFSLSNAVTLGSTTNSSRYFDGMVGEVEIYDKVLDPIEFESQRNAMVSKWIDGAAITSGWRVIPEDTNFPTEDMIVAFCEVSDPVYNLPADHADTDCTAAFQAALNDANTAGGGTVFVPAGQYRIDGTLTVSSNVTLRGRWRKITASQPAAGTIIKVYSGQGSAESTPLITMSGGSGIKDLTFWHPLQEPTNIIPYPFVLSGGQTIENITFVNAYQGVNMSNASMCFVNNVEGTVLQCGFYADQSAAISRFENLNFGPEFWEWADLPDATPVHTAYQTYMLSHGTGIDLREMDGFHMTDCSVRAMKTGVLFAPSPIDGQTPNGGFVSGLDIRDCGVALNLIDVSTTLLDSYLHGTDKAIQSNSGITCNSCTLTGGNTAAEGKGIQAAMTTINGVISQSDGNVQMVACNFTNSGNDVSLGNSVDAVHIAGCTFADGPNIIDYSPASIVKIIDHHPVYGYQAVPQLPAKNMSLVRKPYKENLFDITHYGAIANDNADDSAAFGAAVNAANANGGGIVFVPNGIFDIAGSYTLASGVELRGTSGSIYGASGRTGSKIGSLLQITGNEGNPNGPAFLKLNADCGVRGLSFHYPGQRADMLVPETIIAYPFTIWATGNNTYVTDVFMSNPYQAVHFYRADNHLLEKCKLGGLNKTILVEECSHGRIGKFHLKPDFWRDIWLGDFPTTGEGTEQLALYVGKHLTGIWLKNSTEEMVHSIFNHASHVFMRVDNSSGLGSKIGGEVLQGGFRFSGDRDFSMVYGGPLLNNMGDNTGMWGYWADDMFTGTVSIWNGHVAGTPGKMYYVQSGTLDVQQVIAPGWSERGNVNIQVDSGAILKFKMTNIGRKFGCIFAPEGVVSMQDTIMSQMPNTMLNHPAVFMARNIYSETYISTSPNSGHIVNNGMILDPTHLLIEDSPMFTGSPAKVIQGARTADGDYTIDVIDTDFTNGASRSVDIETYYRVDTDCTIQVYYDSTSGRKLGKSSTFSGATLPDYEWVNFSVSDAQFDGIDDIVIEITGDSPLLNSVNVLRNVSPIIKLLPDLTHDGDVDLEDFAEMSDAWMILYGLDALSAIAENWLNY
jgi:hypothetical protein